MYKYQVNLFEGGVKKPSREGQLTVDMLLMHTGKHGRSVFLELINRWNRNGMIGFENHGKTYLYVALPE